MFWRVLFQLVRVSRWRLLLALVAVAGGGAVCSALLNIHFDAERKLTEEFVTLGPNVVISPPRGMELDAAAPLLDESVTQIIARNSGAEVESHIPYLYAVGRVQGQPVILAGMPLDTSDVCRVGTKAAATLRLSAADQVTIAHGPRQLACKVIVAAELGDQQDSQIALHLGQGQQLIGQPGKASLIKLRVNGSPQVVQAAVARLSKVLPGLQVRAIRQIAEAEGTILSRISVLIFATVALILALTGLCVLSAMTALAMEHRHDVGVMKALGGKMTTVLKLFLSEAAALGAIGGLLGWAAGLALSAWIGRQVFDAAISPRWEVLPLTVAMMTAVALAGAFPLRLLSRVRPGIILRGD